MKFKLGSIVVKVTKSTLTVSTVKAARKEATNKRRAAFRVRRLMSTVRSLRRELNDANETMHRVTEG